MDVSESSPEANDRKRKKKLTEKNRVLDNDTCRTKASFKTDNNYMNHNCKMKEQDLTVQETGSKRKLSTSPDSVKKHKKKKKKTG